MVKISNIGIIVTSRLFDELVIYVNKGTYFDKVLIYEIIFDKLFIIIRIFGTVYNNL